MMMMMNVDVCFTDVAEEGVRDARANYSEGVLGTFMDALVKQYTDLSEDGKKEVIEAIYGGLMHEEDAIQFLEDLLVPLKMSVGAS